MTRNQIDALMRYLDLTEIAAPVGVAAFDLLWADSTAHRLKMLNNNGTAAQVVASGADINTSDQVISLHLGTGSNTTGAFGIVEQAAPGGVASNDLLWADSTAHRLKTIPNNGVTLSLGEVVASGTSALNTGALTAGTCETVVTTAATNAATTDAIEWSHNAAVAAATNGLLIIHAWPTANNVNFSECNPTAGAITPPSDTLNWVVIR